ncbi:hypothetical protein NESM_000917800 [Novymonas esmeraldas]|uniref:Uncharacterized protein n=1 Tax=Novymonas esmeraldas TaxID=1808958 RepID=A0AAW0EZ71_9TRYP
MSVRTTLAPLTVSPSSGSDIGVVGAYEFRFSVAAETEQLTCGHVQKSVPVHTSASVEPGVMKAARNARVAACSAWVKPDAL